MWLSNLGRISEENSEWDRLDNKKYCPKEVIKATSLKTFKAGLLNALERIIILNQSPFTKNEVSFYSGAWNKLLNWLL